MKHGEDSLQIAVANFLRAQYPRLLWWHTPNGGKRNAKEGARLKGMGVLAGVADIVMFWGDKKAAIELKYGKNKLQATQCDFRTNWFNVGGMYAECRSLEEVQNIMNMWGVPKNVTQCPPAFAEGGVPNYKVRSKKKGATSD